MTELFTMDALCVYAGLNVQTEEINNEQENNDESNN